MEFQALERIPEAELKWRWRSARTRLAELVPQAGGLAVFSGPSMYWLTGTWTTGFFWLPLEGDPVLMVRRGLDRARLESAVPHILCFKSYSMVADLCREAGSPLSSVVAAEKAGLSWTLGEMLAARMGGVEFVSGDVVATRARSVKSGWELAKMRLAGERHHRALYEILPRRIDCGMSEREISHAAWQVFFELGHCGMMRMGGFGSEIFLGHVAAGDSANYPSLFDGPVGLRGEHPAVPFMGYAGQVWKPGRPLACDIGFCLEGYVTDKTQVYWPGDGADMPDEARRGHEFCIQAQAWLADNLRPGAVPEDLYAHVVDWAGREDLSEGFMALGSNKVAFLGHGIGLVVDEFPPLAARVRTPLEENMVLALEPKFAIPGLGMVGVENTFQVTPSGGVCITGQDYGMVMV